MFCYNIWQRPGVTYKPLNSYKQSYETLKEIFRQANIENITFSGGEPMLSERFNELVLFAKLKKIFVDVISNGTAVDFHQYEILTKLKVDQFQFPLLSADPLIHDKIVQVDGSWQKVVNTIKKMHEIHSNIIVAIIITKHNVNTVKETIEFIAGLGISDIMLNRYSIGGRGLYFNNSLIPSQEELNNAYKAANELSKKLELSITSNVCTPHCILNPDDFDNIGFVECSSTKFDKPLTIDIEGNVRICNHSPVIIGNIYKTKLKEILDSYQISDWYKQVPDYCNKCDVFNKCQGGCRGASQQLGYPISKEDPIIEIMEVKRN